MIDYNRIRKCICKLTHYSGGKYFMKGTFYDYEYNIFGGGYVVYFEGKTNLKDSARLIYIDEFFSYFIDMRNHRNEMINRLLDE